MYSYLFIKILEGIRLNKTHIIIKEKKKYYEILNILLKYHLIQSYSFDNLKYLKIYLKYFKNKSVIKTIKILKKKKLVNNSLWHLKKNTNEIFILKTHLGFFTNQEIKRIKIPSVILCKISL